MSSVGFINALYNHSCVQLSYCVWYHDILTERLEPESLGTGPERAGFMRSGSKTFSCVYVCWLIIESPELHWLRVGV